MNSFYGGKQGLTYNIIQRFNSVQQMVTAFNQGGAYTKVNYGQYVIVDTISMNKDYTNKENGLLFRRGFDYSQQYIAYDYTQDSQENWKNWLENGVGGGAIYVGQISGPMGLSPRIFLGELETISGNAASTYVNPSTSVFLPAQEGSLQEQFQLGYLNDEQTFEDGSTERVTRIGLRIPYSNINVSATTTDGYGSYAIHNGIRWTPGEVGNESIKGFIHSGPLSNGLYQDLQIAVPKGIKGDSLNNFRIDEISSTPNKTTFQIAYDLVNYDNISAGDAVQRQYNLQIETESIDQLKLIGDYLYYHTYKNEDHGHAIVVDGSGKKWNPLGSPGSQFHVYTYFEAQNRTKESALALLYSTYPNGIDKNVFGTEDPTKAGWIVAIKYQQEISGQPPAEEITELYAYDYTSTSNNPADKWFQLGNFSSLSVTPEAVVILSEQQTGTLNPTPSDQAGIHLANNGLWFLQENLMADAQDWSVLNKTVQNGMQLWQ